jgi:tRNA G18 (ribose-2'-O)-methylase SpoU
MSKEILDLMNQNIKIPMNADVESLNVSIASAIIMYKLK